MHGGIGHQDVEIGSELVPLSGSSSATHPDQHHDHAFNTGPDEEIVGPRSSHFDQVALSEGRGDDSLRSPMLSGDVGDSDTTPRSRDDGSGPGRSHHSASSKHSESLFARLTDWLTDPRDRANKVKLLRYIVVIAAILFVIILAAWAFSGSSSGGSTPPNPNPGYSVRLPLSVFPRLYKMDLKADLETALFEGTMEVELNVAQINVDRVMFHAIDLDIHNVSLALPTETPGISELVPVTNSFYAGVFDLYVVELGHVIPQGSVVTLRMGFNGRILPTLAGFYLSNYTTLSGETRSIASTQFEASDARRAFPCWDEPAFKANWSISLTAREDKIVRSNMPMSSESTLPDGWQKTQFKTSVKMSTYLVAYVVCDFTFVEGKTLRGLPVRVWTSPDTINQTSVALEAAIKAIEKYETFFQLEYPLPKQDMIAIPNFAVGAMENFGLITYRASALLIDPDRIEARTIENVVATVAHELAHQWFGNIVTIAWWNDLWLNEGFASWVEYLGMKAYDPTQQWDEDSSLILGTQSSALSLDSSQYSHSIVVTRVTDPDEMFDDVSYAKGASVLLMLSAVMGFPTTNHLQDGLHAYLTTHAYGNAVSDDLWRSLQGSAPDDLGIDISTLMHGWTKQVGYPLLQVHYDSANPGQVAVTQSRFLLLPYERQDPELRDTQSQYRWDVFIAWTDQTGLDKDKMILFKRDQQSVTLTFDTRGPLDYVYLNKGRSGFYRVSYPDRMWASLAETLREEEPPFNNADLVGIIDDVWTLSATGHTNYSKAFDIVSFLSENYMESTPWSSALGAFSSVHSRLSTKDTTKALFERYIVESLIANNTAASIPWTPKTDHKLQLLQASLVSALVAYGHEPSRLEAQRLWDNLLINGEEIDVNLRPAIYRVGIESGGQSAWDWLWNRYKASIDASERKRILRALCYATDETILEELLRRSMLPNEIKTQDQERVIVYVSLNPRGQSMAWRFVQDNYPELFQRFGSSSFTFSELITYVVGGMQSAEAKKEAQEFFKDKPLGTAERALKQSLELIDTHIYWLEERYDEFETELQKAARLAGI